MTHEILIDGIIGTAERCVSASMVRSMLPANGTDPIEVKIHSEGGSVIEGFAIFDMFRNYQGPKKAIIESSAFSIASFIPMAFDEVEITPNGYMMIHNPYMGIEGDDEELARKSQLLSKLKTNMIDAYAKRTGKSIEEVTSILKQETYLNATEAVAQGFCDRVTAEPVHGRVFAKLNTMPHGVVAALFGDVSGGDKDSKTKEKPMSESTPVAASLEEIETAFPKMKPATILACLKAKKPMASVATAAVDEVMSENSELVEKISAMEEELTALRAKAMDTPAVEDDAPEAKAEDEEAPAAEGDDEEVTAKSGAAPVAKARTTSHVKSATAKWKQEVNARKKDGMTSFNAILKADEENPGLRSQMLAEAR